MSLKRFVNISLFSTLFATYASAFFPVDMPQAIDSLPSAVPFDTPPAMVQNYQPQDTARSRFENEFLAHRPPQNPSLRASDFGFFVRFRNGAPVFYTAELAESLNLFSRHQRIWYIESTVIEQVITVNAHTQYVLTRSQNDYYSSPFFFFVYNPQKPVIHGVNPRLVTFSYDPLSRSNFGAALSRGASLYPAYSQLGIPKTMFNGNGGNIQIQYVNKNGFYQDSGVQIRTH